VSIARCIPQLLAEGKLTPEQAAVAGEVYGRRKAQHGRSMGDAAADALASAETAEALAIAAARKKRLTFLTIDAQKRMLGELALYDRAARGGKAGDPLDPRAIAALFDRDDRAPFSNVEARRKAIRGDAQAYLEQLLADHRRSLTGKLRNKAQMDEIGRALFGETVDSLNAREISDSVSRVLEGLRQRFNAAGGAIGKIDRYGLPTSHDSRSVRKAGYAAWRAAFGPNFERLDMARMVDETTGLPFDDVSLEGAMRDIFETIRTDGWNTRTPGAAGVGSLANRRAEHRFFHFKSYDDWAAYQAEFGAGTAFDALMGHVDAMSRDIAAMEIFGPNPDASVRWLKDGMEKNAALHGDDAGRAGDAAHAGAKRVDRLWAEYKGVLNRPENRNTALIFGAVRSVQTAAKLGGATLGAVTDTGFQMATRRYNGLPAAKTVLQVIGTLNPATAADRRFAVRRGLMWEEAAQRTASQSRYLVEELAGEVGSRLADGTLRVSGLASWTQNQRWLFGMELLDTVQGEFGKGFGEIEPALRGAMERYGIDAKDWEAIRATPLYRHQGQDFFTIPDVADQKVRNKLSEWVLTETDYAVPTADLGTRAMINSVAPRGTIAGEVTRSAFLFKSFGVSVVMSHGRRALMQGSLGGKLGYAAGLTIGLTLFGALAVQLKQIAAGKDPRDMARPDFWGAATLQGGGFGIFGDLIGASQNRFGGGIATTLMGPLAQTAQTIASGDVVRFIDQELPGQSLWYLRTAFDRVVTDQIQSLIDPNYRDAWRRMDRRARDQGSGFWWQPGEILPGDAPDLGTMFGGADGEGETMQ
jgi:hypothetical protein